MKNQKIIRLQLAEALPRPRVLCVPVTDATDKYVALAAAFRRLGSR